MAQPLCYSNAEWLSKQIEYSSFQFSLARKYNHDELAKFWVNRWNKLERHYKELRGVLV